MKITLSICTNRKIYPKTLQCLLDLVNYSKEIDFHILVAERGFNTAENRNYCVIQAQRNGSDFLFFIDDDMSFLSSTLEELLEHKKEIVGVNSYSRCLPPSSTVGLMDKDGKYLHPDKHTDWEMRIPEKLFKAYFVGTGIMLINMEVFNKIKKPYFEFIMGKEGQILHGEDGSFCDKAKKVGIDVYCDPEIYVGHLGEMEYKKPNKGHETFLIDNKT